MNITQLVTEIPTQKMGGIADYSLKLAENLLERYSIKTQFVDYVNRTVPTENKVRDFTTINLSQSDSEAYSSLLSILLSDQCDGVILHYGFYQFPVFFLEWMIKALRKAKKVKKVKLLIIFHEIVPFNMPLSKKIISSILDSWHLGDFDFLTPRVLAKIADEILTNTFAFQSQLSKWVKPQPVTRIANFSTIGEPKKIPSLSDRSQSLIIFGLPAARNRIYNKFANELIQCCQILNIKEIYDVGPKRENIQITSSSISGVNIIEFGAISHEKISELMLSSLAGFIDYNPFPGCLGKSTIFAAFCAHGLIPICSQYNACEPDGLEVNKHYLIADATLKNIKTTQLQSLADNANLWYQTHTLDKVTDVFASALLTGNRK